MLQKYLNTRMLLQHAVHRANILMARKFTIAVGLDTSWLEFHRSSVQMASGQNIVSAAKVKLKITSKLISQDLTSLFSQYGSCAWLARSKNYHSLVSNLEKCELTSFLDLIKEQSLSK